MQAELLYLPALTSWQNTDASDAEGSCFPAGTANVPLPSSLQAPWFSTPTRSLALKCQLKVISN